MKVLEISVTVLVHDDTDAEDMRESIGSAVSEIMPDSGTLLDVSLISSRDVTDQDAEDLTK